MISQHLRSSIRVTGLIVGLVAVLLLGDVVAVHPAAAAFPGENGRIAFARNGRIWIKNADGTQVRLTRGDQPTWSPDGTRIAFHRVSRPASNTNIWTMNADGSNRVRVTSARRDDVGPSWSPDGTKLVFQSLGRRSWGLYIVDSSPPHGTPIRIAGTLFDEQEPRWSPDGTRIAFQVYSCSTTGCGMQIGVVNADGTGYRPLTTRSEGIYDRSPDWSPDSSALLFASHRHSPNNSLDTDIYSVPSAGGVVTRITDSAGDARKSAPVWSPDGTRLLCVAESDSYEITLQTSEFGGGAVEDLGHVGGYHSPEPDWQPLP